MRRTWRQLSPHVRASFQHTNHPFQGTGLPRLHLALLLRMQPTPLPFQNQRRRLNATSCFESRYAAPPSRQLRRGWYRACSGGGRGGVVRVGVGQGRGFWGNCTRRTLGGACLRFDTCKHRKPMKRDAGWGCCTRRRLGCGAGGCRRCRVRRSST